MTPETPKAAPYENPKALGIAGLVLFALGLMSFALVYARHDASPETLRLAAGIAILVGMGYPMALHAGLLKKLASLESRLKELEQRPKS